MQSTDLGDLYEQIYGVLPLKFHGLLNKNLDSLETNRTLQARGFLATQSVHQSSQTPMLIMKEARPREPNRKKIRNTLKEASLMLPSSLLLLPESFAVLLCNHVTQVLLETPVRWILLLSL